MDGTELILSVLGNHGDEVTEPQSATKFNIRSMLHSPKWDWKLHSRETFRSSLDVGGHYIITVLICMDNRNPCDYVPHIRRRGKFNVQNFNIASGSASYTIRDSPTPTNGIFYVDVGGSLLPLV